MAKKPKVSAPLRQYVKRAIHKQIENKTALYVQNIVPISSYVFNTTMNVATCLPTINIAQGVGQSGRIGNTIHTRSLYFNFYLYPNQYDAITNQQPKPHEVLIFIGKLKGQKDRIPTTTDFQKLWQNGNSSTQPYSDLRDLTQNVNTDYFIVYKIMKFKVGFSAITGTGPTVVQQYYQNNDYKYNIVRRVNLTKFAPKVLKFNDTTLSPTNDNLYMWATCVSSDGFTAANTQPVTLGYSFQYVYEDA